METTAELFYELLAENLETCKIFVIRTDSTRPENVSIYSIDFDNTYQYVFQKYENNLHIGQLFVEGRLLVSNKEVSPKFFNAFFRKITIAASAEEMPIIKL